MHWVLIDAPGSFRGFVDLTKLMGAELLESGELSLIFVSGWEVIVPAKEAGVIITRLRDFVAIAEASRPVALRGREARQA